MKRKQYRSNLMLDEMQAYGAQRKDLDCILGVVDADIFVPELNFVFGEACFPGKGALISLWRLKPEFYGDAPDEAIFLSRVVKEAVHEIGHTLGLRHCFAVLALCIFLIPYLTLTLNKPCPAMNATQKQQSELTV
jgi:archaemetzincin